MVLLTFFLLIPACDKDGRNSKQSAQFEGSVTSSTDVLIRKSWHEVEGLRVEPISLPSVSMDKITGLKNGDLHEDKSLPGKGWLPKDIRPPSKDEPIRKNPPNVDMIDQFKKL
jgi:hypothetical protein